MAKMKTKVVVKSHYIGTKTMNEVFSPVLKHQMEQNISQHLANNQEKLLQSGESCDTIEQGILLLESE